MADFVNFLSGTHSSVVRVAEFLGCREDCILSVLFAVLLILEMVSLEFTTSMYLV